MYRTVLTRGLGLTVAGLAIGLALAVPAARLLGQLLYATSAFDPTAFAGTATLLAIVAFVACLIPARRAAVADPLAALRSE